MSGSRNLLFSEQNGKYTKMIDGGALEFIMHAEASPDAEEIARVAKVIYREVY